MADPILSGLLNDSDQAVVTDVLGRQAPVSMSGQSSLPVGGAPVSGGAGPVAPGGTGVSPIASSTGGGGAPAKSGLSDAAKASLATKLGLKAEEAAGKIFGSDAISGARNPDIEQQYQTQRAGERADLTGAGSAAGGFQIPPDVLSGASGGGAFTGDLASQVPFQIPPDVLTGASGGGAAVGGGAAEGVGTGVGSGASEGASGLSGAVGPALAGAGAAYSISQIAQDPNLSDDKKAALSAMQAGAAAAAPFTFGLSELIPLLQPYVGETWSKMGLDPLYSSIFDPSRYQTTRGAAGKEATHELTAMGPAYAEAAKTGDPAQALKALSAPDQKVRADLRLPPEIAQQIGAGSFADMKPESFQKLLDWFAEDPSRISQSLVGSGDVPYLPQKQAQAVADQASKNATQLLTYLTNRKVVQDAMNASGAAPAPEPAPPPKPPTTPAGGGPLGLAEIGLEVGR